MVLEPIVLRSGALTPEQQKANRPGGGGNPATGANGWLRYLIVLQRAHAVHVEGRGGSATDTLSDVEREQAVMDALRAAPEQVELSDGESVAVYPKSYHAMLELHKIDLKLTFLAAAGETARDALPTHQAEALDVLQRAIGAIDYHYGLLAWGATHEGPGLPWTESEASPVVPDRIRMLSALDLYRIAAAYQRVNALRLAAVEGLLTATPKTPGKPVRASWAVFFSVAARELGVKPEALLREWSLGAVLSSMRISRDAEAQAVESADTRQAHRSHGSTEIFG